MSGRLTVEVSLDHLEDKTREAQASFTALIECTYATKSLGKSGLGEIMKCDCPAMSCGSHSDCINRLTSVECVHHECENQRFQRKLYSPLSVVQTEKKGYGIRADGSIGAGNFIYEYIGEVIPEPVFRQRMADYDNKGIKHFYFMMLQKGEFIDATEKGCLARFCNHSCSPNAFVDKWVVGEKLKMGIFAKRDISAGEEITFNYNVDRYGAEAQPCFCEAKNCIGFLGGRTQTDSAKLLPQTVSEALRVTYKMERKFIKDNRGIAEDQLIGSFVSQLGSYPVEDVSDASKVMSALMLGQDEIVSKKLIERISNTHDDTISRCIIKLHGYEIFATLIRDYWQASDLDSVKKVLLIMCEWPNLTKNKISSSQIEPTLRQVMADAKDSEVRQIISELLDRWGSLHMAYRIPKREDAEKLDGVFDDRRRRNDIYEDKPLPEGWEWAESEEGVYFYNRVLNQSQWERPVSSSPPPPSDVPKAPKHTKGKKSSEDKHTKLQKQREVEEKKLKQERESQAQRKLQDLAAIIASAQTANPKDPPFVKQWTKFFAQVVPNMCSKYEKTIGREYVKSCAKKIVAILTDKELKRNQKAGPPDMTQEKKDKVGYFVKSYMKKYVENFPEKNGSTKRQKTNP